MQRLFRQLVISGATSIMWAALYGNLEVVKLLLAYGGNVNHASVSGAMSIMWTALYGNLKVVKLLLAHGGDVNYVHKDGIQM